MCAALVLSLVLVASVEVWLCQDSLSQCKRKCQMVMISYFATTLLLQRHEQRYKFVVKEVCQLLHKSTFDVRTGGVPQSLISKELLNNS